MVRSVKDLLRRSNGRACLEYDELEASLIEIESVINARPLNYIGEGADDPLPITPNQCLNNRRSTCATPEPAVNLLAPTSTHPPTSTSAVHVELDKERREYVSNIFSLLSKITCCSWTTSRRRKPGRKIRVGEVVLIHEENPKRLMWSTGLVLELRKSCDGLVRSVVLRSPNGNIINRAIQCLYPLEIRNDIWNASYKHVLYKMKRMLLKTGFITNRFHSVWVNSKTGLLGSCPLYKLGWKIPWKNGWGWKPFGCGFNSMQWNTLKTFARKHYIQVNTVHVLEIWNSQWKYHSWTPFFTTSFTTSHV
jgi:hypothetical protein